MSKQNDGAGSGGIDAGLGLSFRVVCGSETSPVRVELLDENGRVTSVRPGSGQELLMYRMLQQKRAAGE